jgi:hypothetical protein
VTLQTISVRVVPQTSLHVKLTAGVAGPAGADGAAGAAGAPGEIAAANSPNAGEFARFTSGVAIEGLTEAEFKAAANLEAGTDYYSVAGANAAFQPIDADLTTLATPTAWRVFYSDGSQVITQLALGADGTFLKSNGASSAPTFATPAGSGDVSKVGTPVDNQIGVWTGDGTIEGDAALTFDTSIDTLAIAASGSFAFGAVVILDDNAGTTTLQNIDALDATTEATIEAAVDTLANLTSIQGRTVTLADAGANAFFGWDDAAGAYENLTAAEAEAIIEPLIDTLANLTSVQGLTITLADAGADALLGWDDSASAYQNLSAADARTALGLATGDSPQFTAVNIGAATDTTLARVSAGVISVEGVTILTTATGQPLDADLTSWAGVTRASGFDTFAATPSSANLKTLVTDETGSGGALVFATGPTLTDPQITGAILEDIFTITDGAGFEIDPSNGTLQRVVLGASRTPAATNFANGESVTLMVDDGSAFTITWTTVAVVWVGGVAPTLATSGFSIIELWKEGNVIRGVSVGSTAS